MDKVFLQDIPNGDSPIHSVAWIAAACQPPKVCPSSLFGVLNMRVCSVVSCVSLLEVSSPVLHLYPVLKPTEEDWFCELDLYKLNVFLSMD